MNSHDSHERLERAIHATLRQLPPRQAPAILEQRVLAAIAARAALPWWRKSFVHWPLAARAAFFLASVIVARIVLLGTSWALSGFDGARLRGGFQQAFAWIDALMAVGRALATAVEPVLRALPTPWLYGGLAVFAFLYVTLFGLGAAAFRNLRTQR